jgi:hypothetical protein
MDNVLSFSTISSRCRIDSLDNLEEFSRGKGGFKDLMRLVALSSAMPCCKYALLRLHVSVSDAPRSNTAAVCEHQSLKIEVLTASLIGKIERYRFRTAVENYHSLSQPC